MRWILGLALVGGLLLAYGVKAGWFSPEDPALAVERYLAAIQPGMSWEQVADIREPRDYTPYDFESENGSSYTRKFKRELIREELLDNLYKDGFAWEYHFSAAHALRIDFDRKGNVVAVDKPFTAKDLYDGKLPGL